jgi:phospholipid-transporting ATPase
MYGIDKDRPAKVSNSTLIEELGQVDYLFSDKTGTLTRNEMQMRAIAVGTNIFDSITDSDGVVHFET